MSEQTKALFNLAQRHLVSYILFGLGLIFLLVSLMTMAGGQRIGSVLVAITMIIAGALFYRRQK